MYKFTQDIPNKELTDLIEEWICRGEIDHTDPTYNACFGCDNTLLASKETVYKDLISNHYGIFCNEVCLNIYILGSF